MSDIDPASENVYVHSLEVNGNLIVKGTHLFTTKSKQLSRRTNEFKT